MRHVYFIKVTIFVKHMVQFHCNKCLLGVHYELQTLPCITQIKTLDGRLIKKSEHVRPTLIKAEGAKFNNNNNTNTLKSYT